MSEVIKQSQPANGTVRLLKSDITLAQTDAIVNAANSALQHGGGVAGAIVDRGGSEIQRESDEIGHCPEGDAVVTGAGDLHAEYVIHTVGPKGSDPEGDEKLASAINSSLASAQKLELESISIPAISSGIFGFPKDRCAQILLAQAKQFLQNNPHGSLQQIDFCIIDDPTVAVFSQHWDEVFG